MTTDDVGILPSRMVNVALPPVSVVTRPWVGLMMTEATLFAASPPVASFAPPSGRPPPSCPGEFSSTLKSPRMEEHPDDAKRTKPNWDQRTKRREKFKRHL